MAKEMRAITKSLGKDTHVYCWGQWPSRSVQEKAKRSQEPGYKRNGEKCILVVQDGEISCRRQNEGKKSIAVWDYWVNGDDSSIKKSQVLNQVVGAI